MDARDATATAATTPDPVIEAYKSGIDRTLIVENLRRTPEERLANLASLQRFASRFRGAASAAVLTHTAK